MERIKPSYSKALRAIAKERGLHLATVDLPGICYKGPITTEQVKEATEMLTRWFTHKAGKSERQTKSKNRN